MNMPIDVVPGSNPPIFRWRQTVETVSGRTTVNHEGTLAAPVESAIVALIKLAKQLAAENDELRKPQTSKQPVKAGK